VVSSAPVEARAPLFASLSERLAFAVLCAVLAASPTQLSGFWPVTHDYWPQSLALMAALLASLLLALSGSQPSHGARKLQISPLGACLLAFAAWNGLSLLFAPYKHDALLETSRLAAALVWFPIARRLIFRGNSQVLAERTRLCLALASAALGALWACFGAVLGFLSQHLPQQASFYNTNLFAFCVAMSLPLIGSAWLLSRRLVPAKIADVVGLGALGLGACGLLISASKGGLIAGALGMLAFAGLAWSSRREQVSQAWRARRETLLPLVLVGALVLGALGAKTVLPRIERAGGSESHSAMFRLYTWRGTVAMADARPILGHGPGSFPTSFPAFEQAGYTRSAHQSWLQIAAESGWPSLGFLLGAIAFGLMRARKYLKDTARPHRAWAGAGAASALVAALVHGMMDSGWSILSIALLLSFCLALLDAPESAPPGEEDVSPSERRPLSWAWLLAVLPLALAASYGLKAQGAENAREDSRAALASGSREDALRLASRATEDVPLDARAWANRAQLKEATSDRPGAIQDYAQAAKLQPNKALYPLRIAQLLDGEKKPDTARQYFDKALALDPHDTSLRLQRAEFRERSGDSRGALEDYQAIVDLEDAPFGKYPATPEIVNGDFNRARLALARDAFQRGDKARARTLAERGLREAEATRASNRTNKLMIEAVQMYSEGLHPPAEDELSEQERAFRALLQ